MANRQGDFDLRFSQVSVPQLELWLGFGLAYDSVRKDVLYDILIEFGIPIKHASLV